MTLEELDNTLPNGLHDARISSFVHNFEEAAVQLTLEILVGLPDEPGQNRYKNALMTFRRVLFSVIEMPDNERILGVPGSIWFKFWRLEREELAEKIAKRLSKDALCYTFYILEWEACIKLAAMEMSFEWIEA